jgi:Plants and Prokaryotes Conserved (PCC) domain
MSYGPAGRGSAGAGGLRAGEPHLRRHDPYRRRNLTVTQLRLDADSSHPHISVSDAREKRFGGHLVEGCRIYATAEMVIGELPELKFSRELDPASGYPELKIDAARL